MTTDGATMNRIKKIMLAACAALVCFAFPATSAARSCEGGSAAPFSERAHSICINSQKRPWIGIRDQGVFAVYASAQSEPVSNAADKKFAPLEMQFVQMLLGLLAAGLVTLVVWVVMHRRANVLIKQKQEYKKFIDQAINMIAALIDTKSPYLEGHSRRTAKYSMMVGERLGMSQAELEELYYAAIMHDIGKIGIPDSILNHRGRYSDADYAELKKHVEIGGRLLDMITVMGNISQGARYHHERIDGGGYGTGTKGSDIPLVGKIINVCSAFDSMMSNQPQRPAMEIGNVQSELLHNVGKQFDEKITAIFISLINEGAVPLKPEG